MSITHIMQIVHIFTAPQILKAHNWQDVILGILGLQNELITQITLESGMLIRSVLQVH